ncbi:urease accessory protein UreH [Paenibacillus sp. BIHB 4019]|uniref:Urease accessory protein UreH n=1 Tax=Paenibacillus sp. BIHB 4019 TaxID=1870819 RepID=A0A1B2DKY8_9BACL|nr:MULTISPECIES: urease accessory protein UreH [unclassified Paenibacillus]ANY68380.1 urease accessory protein UreH [Paenibacillus sp. BIHB 4019]KQO17867.1 urease accessory protein UreH [Paenibacillus sp. Leaf72]
MDAGILSVLAIGFLLGIKHALEPDHVIAVSTIAIKSKHIVKSAFSGVFWGIGHSLTLFIVGFILMAMRSEMTEKWAMSLEFLVGVMIVVLGVNTMISLRNRRAIAGAKDSQHFHGSYRKSLLIGFIHGLAGSGAMVVLTMSTVNSISEGLIYIVVFGVGTVIGMLCFTTFISIPFILSSSRFKLNRVLIGATGVVSAVFGLYYMYNLGVNEGLFGLWV